MQGVTTAIVGFIFAALLFPKLIHWKELDRGGHFAAFEQPALFVGELRDCFRSLR